MFWIEKLTKDVNEKGLGLIVFGDWYNNDVLHDVKFFDENTREFWTPATGGANVPALNDLLKPFHIGFGDKIFSGDFTDGECKNRIRFLSGNSIKKFPANGFVKTKKMLNQGKRVLNRGTTSDDVVLFGMIAAIFLREVRKEKNINNSSKIDNQTLKEALKEAFNHKGFILLTFGFFVCGFNITLVSAHIPSYIQERGFEIWTAAAILSLIGLFNVFGTLSFGYLSGKYSKKILLSILYFARGIVLILFLILPTSTYVAIGFGVLYGFLWLATIPPTNGIISQIFGTKYLATLYGIVFFSHQIGSFFGAYLGGYFYDQHGSFDYAWYLSIALSFLATIVHLPIDEKPLPRLATV